MAGSRYWIDKQPSDKGFLRLEGDPGPWIEANSGSRLLVRSLVLEAQIGDSIRELTELNCLKIYNGKFLRASNAITTLFKLKDLRLINCRLEEFPRNLCQLVSLTHLSLKRCENITKLPANLGQLDSLTHLELSDCNNLTELPETLGHLEGLRYLTLDDCNNIKSLPDSMNNLYNLEAIDIACCFYIKELPVDLKVLQLNLVRSSIKFLPRGLVCQHLQLSNTAGVLVHPNGSVSIQRLTIVQEADFYFCLSPNLNINPSILSIDAECSCISQVLASLDELSGLMLLDLKDSIVKWLPWSIMKLRKLRTLILPKEFRLESLPYHLNDSVTISVSGKHVRKTWKELKIEMEPRFFPDSGEVMAMEEAQNPYDAEFPPNYLLLDRDTTLWIDLNYCNSLTRIRFLDLELPNHLERERLGNFIEELKELTHLYVENSKSNDLLLPKISTRLTHLCLRNCYYTEFYSTGLGKLSNMETLDIYFCGKLPTDMDLPVSLKRLSLRKATSLPVTIKKLPNLKALDLSVCLLEGSNPLGDLNCAKLKLSHCRFTHLILPTDLRHLEVWWSSENNCSLEEFLSWLVNLETLSVTCGMIESFPSIAGPCNLRELRLKDCFNLKNLPANLADMIELRILDISGTRIKSLPHSILDLHKLQQLILPKWFRLSSLPMSLKKVSIIDDTVEAYYEIMDEMYPIATNEGYDIDGVVEAGIQGSELEVNAEQGIPYGGNTHHAQRDIARAGEDGWEETEMVVDAEQEFAHGRNNHHPSENRQNLNPQSDIASDDEAGFEELEMEVIGGQDIAHAANNHHASENGQNKNPQSDSKHKTQRKDISKEMIESCWARNMTLVEAAEEFGVRRSTLKRRLQDLNLKWQKVDAKKRKYHIEQTSGNTSDQNLVNVQLRMPNHECRNYNAANISMHNPTMGPVIDTTVMETRHHMDGHQHAQQHLGSATECPLSNTMQHNRTSSMFVVKATYNEDTVRFEFCLAYSIEKLYEEVGKMLKLDVTFKIKYLDEDNDWILMASIFNLEHALSLSKLSGSNVVRLSVVAKT